MGRGATTWGSGGLGTMGPELALAVARSVARARARGAPHLAQNIALALKGAPQRAQNAARWSWATIIAGLASGPQARVVVMASFQSWE
ncbi:MAG TPA: hypothetical protein VME46_21615 [Acidimicrobiales bacterium]|nr:hypothetical protein [Acidimicrobiales bacterium]